jgi:NAD(P)-dependent dehydrogenase (short-subunit alcohol dehydrogenase family)
MEALTHEHIYKLPLDVNNDDDIQKVTNTILQDQGRIDILVNNAGMLGSSKRFAPSLIHVLPDQRDSPQLSDPVLDLTRDAAMHVLNTNVVAAIQVSKAVAPSMARHGHGRIINIGSISGIM